jgi:hypothetical protein
MPLTNQPTNSSAYLAADPQFQARVKAELVVQCQNVINEAITTAGLMLHVRRAQFAANVLTSLGGTASSWPQVFAVAAATDTNVLSDATQGNTVDVTGANAATQALLVTDVHLGNAISAQFNGFLQPT